MWLKACLRCKLGDVVLDEDGLRHCLQCGHIQYSSADPTIASELAQLLRMDDGDGAPTLTDGVQRALGREPRDFTDYSRDDAASGVWAGVSR